MNRRTSARTSATDLPLTAWLIIDAELCEIEQPWPPTLMSRDDAVVDLQVDVDLVAAQRVVADGVGRRRRQLAAVARACGSGRG